MFGAGGGYCPSRWKVKQGLQKDTQPYTFKTDRWYNGMIWLQLARLFRRPVHRLKPKGRDFVGMVSSQGSKVRSGWA